jgi:hypothetical protein
MPSHGVFVLFVACATRASISDCIRHNLYGQTVYQIFGRKTYLNVKVSIEPKQSKLIFASFGLLILVNFLVWPMSDGSNALYICKQFRRNLNFMFLSNRILRIAPAAIQIDVCIQQDQRLRSTPGLTDVQ